MFGVSAFAAVPFGALLNPNADVIVSGVQGNGQVGPAFVQGIANPITTGLFGFGAFADAGFGDIGNPGSGVNAYVVGVTGVGQVGTL